MPGIEVEEGHQEVQANGRRSRDDEIREDVVAKLEGSVGSLELRDDNVECCKGGVCHYYGVDDHTGHEHAFGAVCALVLVTCRLQRD